MGEEQQSLHLERALLKPEEALKLDWKTINALFSPASSTTVSWQTDPLLPHHFHLCAMKTEKLMWTWLAPNYSAVHGAIKSSFKSDSSQIYTNTHTDKTLFHSD